MNVRKQIKEIGQYPIRHTTVMLYGLEKAAAWYAGEPSLLQRLVLDMAKRYAAKPSG